MKGGQDSNLQRSYKIIVPFTTQLPPKHLMCATKYIFPIPDVWSLFIGCAKWLQLFKELFPYYLLDLVNAFSQMILDENFTNDQIIICNFFWAWREPYLPIVIYFDVEPVYVFGVHI